MIVFDIIGVVPGSPKIKDAEDNDLEYHIDRESCTNIINFIGISNLVEWEEHLCVEQSIFSKIDLIRYLTRDLVVSVLGHDCHSRYYMLGDSQDRLKDNIRTHIFP